MNKFAIRIGAAAATALTVGLLIVPASFAATCTISGNGAGSHNTCKISGGGGSKHKDGHGTVQVNNADVDNNVVVVSSTGGNKANENTGGNVGITSGDSTVHVNITNTVNSNSTP